MQKVVVSLGLTYTAGYRVNAGVIELAVSFGNCCLCLGVFLIASCALRMT
jgi:hypothetical protein